MIFCIDTAGWLSIDDLSKCKFRYWCGKKIEQGSTKGFEMLCIQVG